MTSYIHNLNVDFCVANKRFIYVHTDTCVCMCIYVCVYVCIYNVGSKSQVSGYRQICIAAKAWTFHPKEKKDQNISGLGRDILPWKIVFWADALQLFSYGKVWVTHGTCFKGLMNCCQVIRKIFRCPIYRFQVLQCLQTFTEQHWLKSKLK